MPRRGRYLELRASELPDIEQTLIRIATKAAHNSRCRRRKVGAAGYTIKGEIISDFNGKGCNPGNPCSHRGMAEGTNLPCDGIHAEIQVLRRAGFGGLEALYTMIFPCVDCAEAIIMSKTGRVLFGEDYGGNVSLNRFLEEGVDVVHVIK